MTVDLNDLRQTADAETVLAAYGIYPDGHGFIYCLKHEDNHPSMKVYKHNVYCWSCKASLDCLDIIQTLEECSLPQAVKRLQEILGIRANTQTRAEVERIKRQRARAQARKKALTKAYANECELLQIFESAYHDIVPKEITDEFRNDSDTVETAIMLSQAIDRCNKKIDKYEILLEGGVV